MKRKSWQRKAALCWVAGVLAVPALGGVADRPPVPIRQALLLTPEETAGTGLAPEVKVEVTVDPRGRVSAVEVLEIEPASDFDDLFRRITVDNILQWRYAPAIENGQPAEASLEWSVKYQAKADSDQTSGGADDPFLRSDPSQLQAELKKRNEAWRKGLIERYSKSAEAHMDPIHRRRFDSPHFIVVTDAEEPTTAKIIAGNLEATYALLDSLFQPKLQPLPESFKTLVYLFRERTRFASAATDLRVPGWSSAAYKAPGFLLFHLEVGTSENLLHSLLHESFHAYSDSYLRRPGLEMPRWLEEGFAEYVSNSQIKKGTLIPGQTLRGEFAFRHYRAGVERRATRAGLALDDLKKAIRKGEAVSTEELLRTDVGIFYGPRGDLYYPTAWLFVHFLRHGQEEWAETRFPALLLYLVEGYPAEEALRAIYGASPAELDAQFREYVRTV